MISDKIKKLSLGVSFSVILTIFGVFSVVFSQSTMSIGPTISINPLNPKFNQQVSVAVSLPSVDLDNSTILWQVNGVTKKEGLGEKSFSFRTEKNGNVSLIRVEITDNKGVVFENFYEVSPSEVDLIIEPGSFVPPFYKGRSVFIRQGKTKVVAVTNILSDGVKIPEEKLTFKWKQDGIVLLNSSGKGKNVFTVNGTVPIKNINVTVEIYSSNSKFVGSDSITITPHDANIIFYEDSPLYGKLFNDAYMGTENIGLKEELLLTAYPLFFNTTNETSDEVKYIWYASNKEISTDGPVNTLLLRQTGAKGDTSISLRVEGISRIFQYAVNSFRLVYGSESN